MPCYDPGPEDNFSYNTQIGNLQTKLDNVTRMLCGICTAIGYRVGGHPSEASVEGCNVMELERIKGLREWWREHQVFDEIRLSKAKQSGLAKLTDDEKEALGL